MRPNSMGVALIAATLLSVCLRNGEAAEGDITTLKRLYPSTPLVTAGKPVMAIVVPSDEFSRALARQLAGEIRRRGSAAPEILDADQLVSGWWEIDFDAIRGRSLLALGNSNTNRLLSVLWGAGCTDEDSSYPGVGGYVVRTVHDPFAKGFNVVVLAGSEAEGVRLAVEAFSRKHLPPAGRTLVLRAPITDVHMGREPSPYVAQEPGGLQTTRHRSWPSAAALSKDLEEVLAANAIPYADPQGATARTLVNVTGALATIADAYFHTGDPALPPMMKQVVDRNRELLQVAPRRVEMEAASSAHMLWWDLVEELPVWTDQDRLEVTNAFLRDARQGFEHRLLSREEIQDGYVQKVDENHGTNAALHTLNIWGYFDKYYPSSESAYWMSAARATFAGCLASFQLLEDSAQYNVYVPAQTTSYALASRDMRYFQLGIGAEQLTRHVQTAFNNLGLNTGFGDSPFGPVFWWDSQMFYTMGWFLRDPRVTWWLRSYLPNQCGQDVFATNRTRLPLDLGMELKEPTEWTGMQLFPIWKQTLGTRQTSKQLVTLPQEPAGSEWFSKVVFREAWSPQAQYLLLDGAGAFRPYTGYPLGPAGHKHSDINTITNFTDEGRMWLVDHTYSSRSITEHSGLTITRDGSFSHDDRPARFRDAAEGVGFALTRSVVEGYSGAEWERTLFWYKGHHFVALDRAIAREPGDYAVRCSFRTLGKATLDGVALQLEQQGKRCRITSDGGAARDFQTTVPVDAKSWEMHYPYAEPVFGAFQQDKRASLASGQALSFVNLIQAGESGSVRDSLSLVSDSAALVTVASEGAEGVVAYGLGNPPGGIAAASAYAIGADAALFAGLTRLGKEEAPVLSSSAPVTLCLSSAEGLHVEARAPVAVTLAGGEVKQLPAGRHPLKLDQTAGLLRDSLAAAQRQASSHTQQQGPGDAAAAAPALKTRKVALQSGANAVAIADLNGDGRKEWVVAAPDGARAYTPSGALLWHFATDQPCRAIAAGDVDGDAKVEVAVGCDDGKLHLLGGDGASRWSFACKATSSAPSLPVDFVQIVDVDGDGKPEILAAAHWVHCLDATGSVKWESYLRYNRNRYWGDASQVAIGDYDADGNAEIVVTYNDTYPRAVSYDGAGKEKPLGLKFNTPQGLAIVGLTADAQERKEIAVGTADGLGLFRTHGDELGWSYFNDSGNFTHVVSSPPRGGASTLYAATDMGAVIAYRAAGESAVPPTVNRVWARVTGERITQLTAVAPGLVMAGTKGGAVLVLDGDSGKVLARTPPTGSPVVQLLQEGEATLIVHADGVVETMVGAARRGPS